MSVSPTESPLTYPTAPIRVEKGEATEEELAVLAVLLLSRSAQAGPGTELGSPGTASWRPHPFHAPHSWQRT